MRTRRREQVKLSMEGLVDQTGSQEFKPAAPKKYLNCGRDQAPRPRREEKPTEMSGANHTRVHSTRPGCGGEPATLWLNEGAVREWSLASVLVPA